MRLTKEQIEDRLNGLINEIIDAEHDYANADSFYGRSAKQYRDETRKRVMDTLIEIYIG